MNKLLNQQLRELLADSPTSNRKLGCEGALRAGACTLYRAAPGAITATTVVCDLQGADLDTFESLVQDIADEYGLEAVIQQQQWVWSVRFTMPQPPPIPIEAPPASRSVFARLLWR